MPSCSSTYSGNVITNDCIAQASSLPGGVVGVAYSETLTAPDLIAPLSWIVLNGTVPDGTQLNPDTGELYGVPTLVNDFSFQVQVTDTNGVQCLKNFTLAVAPAVNWWTDVVWQAPPPGFYAGDPAAAYSFIPPVFTGMLEMEMALSQPQPDSLDGAFLSITGTKNYTGPAINLNAHVEISVNNIPGFVSTNTLQVQILNGGTIIDQLVSFVGSYDLPISIPLSVAVDYQILFQVSVISQDGLAADFQCEITLSET